MIKMKHLRENEWRQKWSNGKNESKKKLKDRGIQEERAEQQRGASFRPQDTKVGFNQPSGSCAWTILELVRTNIKPGVNHETARHVQPTSLQQTSMDSWRGETIPTKTNCHQAQARQDNTNIPSSSMIWTTRLLLTKTWGQNYECF